MYTYNRIASKTMFSQICACMCTLWLFSNKKKIFSKFFTKKIFFKQLVVAHSIFILYGWVQLFWADFDMHVTVVPLKVALRLGKFDFWAFQ